MNSFARILAAFALVLAVFAGDLRAEEREDLDGRGRELFYFSCATCHVGSTALLNVAPPPDLFRDPLARGDSEEALFAVIRVGAGTPRMPKFAEGLDEAETRAIVRFIRRQRAEQ